MKKTIFNLYNELFANYFGDCDCVQLEDGSFKLISWDETIEKKKILDLIKTIIDDGFDMSEWEIFEIPAPTAIMFNSKLDDRKRFTMELENDGKWYPYYIKSWNGYNAIPGKAESIEEAAKKTVLIVKIKR